MKELLITTAIALISAIILGLLIQNFLGGLLWFGFYFVGAFSAKCLYR